MLHKAPASPLHPCPNPPLSLTAAAAKSSHAHPPQPSLTPWPRGARALLRLDPRRSRLLLPRGRRLRRLLRPRHVHEPRIDLPDDLFFGSSAASRMPSRRPLLGADLSFFFLGYTSPPAKFVASPSSIDSSEPLYVSSCASPYLFLVDRLLCRRLLASLTVPPPPLWSPARLPCFLCFFSTHTAGPKCKAP